MKRITNTSLQGWSIPLKTEKGYKTYYLAPVSSIQIPDSYITPELIRYQQRSLISIKKA